MPKQTTETNEYSVIKILQSEAGRYAAIALFFVPLIGFAWKVQTAQQDIRSDIELIKQNHFAHIEQINKEQLELKQEQVEIAKQVVELQKQQLVLLERISR